MDTKKEFKIVDGPSKDRLFDACKYAYDARVKFIPRIEIAVGYDGPGYIPARIKQLKLTGIEHEDGSGQSLNLFGNCLGNFSDNPLEGEEMFSYNFHAYYNAGTRTGKIVLS